jgi:hypothetical protein
VTSIEEDRLTERMIRVEVVLEQVGLKLVEIAGAIHDQTVAYAVFAQTQGTYTARAQALEDQVKSLYAEHVPCRETVAGNTQRINDLIGRADGMDRATDILRASLESERHIRLSADEQIQTRFLWLVGVGITTGCALAGLLVHIILTKGAL